MTDEKKERTNAVGFQIFAFFSFDEKLELKSIRIQKIFSISFSRRRRKNVQTDQRILVEQRHDSIIDQLFLKINQHVE